MPKRCAANKPEAFIHNKACNVFHIYPEATANRTHHIISENHITNPMRNNGFRQSDQRLESIVDTFVHTECHICHTWYKSKVLYKFLDDRIKRKRDINDLLQVDYDRTDIKKPIMINTIPKIDTSTISKSLKYHKNRK